MKTTIGVEQKQKLLFSQRMHRALHILQAPTQNLETMIEQEVMLNPLLEIEEKQNDENKKEKDSPKELDFTSSSFSILKELDETFVRAAFPEEEKVSSPLDHLHSQDSMIDKVKKQIRETLTEKQQEAVLLLIEYLDERGFFTGDLHAIAKHESVEIETLKKALSLLQQLEPPGIGAKNPHESLLLQLKRKSAEKSLAYQIIDTHFDDLLCRRIGRLANSFRVEEEQITTTISKEIASLSPYPFPRDSSPAIDLLPDISIAKHDENWHIEIHQDRLPKLLIAQKYAALVDSHNLSEEEKREVSHYLQEGKLFIRSLARRKNTLMKIASKILEKNRDFFNFEKEFRAPLSMTSLADELQLHPSTISRAIEDKVLDTPRGRTPLFYFFSSSLQQKNGKGVASRDVKEMINSTIAKEDPKAPLSDEQIAQILHEKNIECARRTVAKYRNQLSIPSARFRKK